MENNRHQAFPVTFEEQFASSQTKAQASFGALRGLILRSQLKILLKEKAFGSSAAIATFQPPIPLEAFRMYYPRHPVLEVTYFSTF